MSSSSQDKPDIILLMIVSGHYTTALFCVIILLIIIPQPWIWPLICNISWYPCQRWTLSQRFVWAGREWVEMFREEKVVTQRHPRHLMTPGWHLMTLWPSCCQTRAGPDTSPVQWQDIVVRRITHWHSHPSDTENTWLTWNIGIKLVLIWNHVS